MSSVWLQAEVRHGIHSVCAFQSLSSDIVAVLRAANMASYQSKGPGVNQTVGVCLRSTFQYIALVIVLWRQSACSPLLTRLIR